MKPWLDHRQMVRARAMVQILLLANLAGVLTILLDLIGFAIGVAIGFAILGATSLACWWLARLPLGRGYRWFMASSAIAAAGALFAIALAYLGSGPSGEAPAALAFASEIFSIAAPLLLCQAMLLFSRRAGIAGLGRAWHRARLALLAAYGSWIVLVAFEHFSEELSAMLGSMSTSVELALVMLVSGAGILVLLFMLLALFRTQREIGLATRQAAERPTTA